MPDPRPGPLTVLLKTLARVKTRGPAEIAILVKDRISEGVGSRESLVFLWREAGGETSDNPGLTVREARSEDAERYARDVGTDSPRTFRARLASGARCFVVIEGQKLVHATWATREHAWTRELRTYVGPPPGDAYVYESFTRREMRGRGVYPFALKGIGAALGREGVTRVWVAVEAHNRPSLRAVAKAGFRSGFELPFSRRLGRLTIGPPEGELAPAAPAMVESLR